MDPNGHIYEITDEEMAALRDECATEIPAEQIEQMKQDVARLEGYLKGRADSDRPKRGKGANKDLVG